MSCFNNTESIERIVYAVISHLNDIGVYTLLKNLHKKIDITW